MKKDVKIAILQYIPSYERDEKINVAVVLHSPQDNFLKTKIVTNFKRIKEFDDEIDIQVIKNYLYSIREEFSDNLINKMDIDLKDEELLSKMTKYYVNQFYFKIQEATTDMSCNDYLELAFKNYLYFDVDKRNRVTDKETKDFFETILNRKNIQFERMGAKNALFGNYDERINVDYKINNDYYKFITFTEKNIDTYMSTIKMWMLNSLELKDANKNLKFIVNGYMDDEKCQKFINMLSKYAEVKKFGEELDI